MTDETGPVTVPALPESKCRRFSGHANCYCRELSPVSACDFCSGLRLTPAANPTPTDAHAPSGPAMPERLGMMFKDGKWLIFGEDDSDSPHYAIAYTVIFAHELAKRYNRSLDKDAEIARLREALEELAEATSDYLAAEREPERLDTSELSPEDADDEHYKLCVRIGKARRRAESATTSARLALAAAKGGAS